MATCVNAATREFSKVTLDDAGSLTKQHSSENTTSDVPDILNANSGFEDGEISGVPADGWVEESGNPLAFRTGVSFEGDNALYFAPNDSLDRVTQIMNLTGMSGRDYEFTVRYQALQASGLSGRLYFVVHHREVEYGPDTDPDNCAWPSGRDENDVNWPKGVWEKTIDVRVLPVTASSWLGLNSGDPTVHNHANPSATGAWAWFPPSDAVDIRLRLRSSLKSGGAFVPVRIDNLTIRDCGTAIAGPDTKCSEYSPM